MSTALVGTLRQQLAAAGQAWRTLRSAAAQPSEIWATSLTYRQQNKVPGMHRGATAATVSTATPCRPLVCLPASAHPQRPPAHRLQVLEVAFNTGERFSYPAEYLRVESPAAGNQDARDARGRLKASRQCAAESCYC
jgi:hypothetical protein